jgi:hypothetical protein
MSEEKDYTELTPEEWDALPQEERDAFFARLSAQMEADPASQEDRKADRRREREESAVRELEDKKRLDAAQAAWKKKRLN